MVYKVSYVVDDGQHPGAIANVDEPPKLGDRVLLGRNWFEVVEVMELMPPNELFGFLHATVRLVAETEAAG
ncbi:MAG: hypothetical protein GYB68_04135 [Chloroflexi bacterium]|nr:hypothetical protein [Chloroflexota bacterium]